MNCKFLMKSNLRKLRKKFPRSQTRDAVNKDCYLYEFENTEDWDLFNKELDEARIFIYKFNIEHGGIGAKRICPWCISRPVKVEDWAAHCAQYHKNLDSTDALRRMFAGYKCQTALYKKLAARLIENWKILGVLEGGCYQCTDARKMFDETENKAPYRCVRKDTPKSRMRDFAYIGINVKKLKKCYGLGKNDLLGAIVAWKR